jgi:hypothetical protein
MPGPLGSTRNILYFSSLSASPLREGDVRSSIAPVGRIEPFLILFTFSFSKGSQVPHACTYGGLGPPRPAAQGRGARRLSVDVAYFRVGSRMRPCLWLRASGRAAGGSFVGAGPAGGELLVTGSEILWIVPSAA